jgi:nucleotide-binding universal stress UspA family protein
MFPAETIMVATDLTRNCESALRTAGELALIRGAKLHVLHALELSGNPYIQHPRSKVTFHALVEEAEAGLAEQVRQTVPPGVDVASIKAELFLPWKAIVQCAQDVDAEVIVLGPHISVTGDRLMGSTSDRVVRFADVPCLIVPQGSIFKPTRIVLAIDGSPATVVALREAVAWANAIAERTACQLEIVHCTSKDGVASGEQLIARTVKEARTGLVAGLVSIAGQLLRNDDPVEELVQFADGHGAQLLIMASAGHGAVDRVITGSTVSGVVDRVSCATLVVPYRPASQSGTRPHVNADAVSAAGLIS